MENFKIESKSPSRHLTSPPRHNVETPDVRKRIRDSVVNGSTPGRYLVTHAVTGKLRKSCPILLQFICDFSSFVRIESDNAIHRKPENIMSGIKTLLLLAFLSVPVYSGCNDNDAKETTPNETEAADKTGTNMGTNVLSSQEIQELLTNYHRDIKSSFIPISSATNEASPEFGNQHGSAIAALTQGEANATVDRALSKTRSFGNEPGRHILWKTLRKNRLRGIP